MKVRWLSDGEKGLGGGARLTVVKGDETDNLDRSLVERYGYPNAHFEVIEDTPGPKGPRPTGGASITEAAATKEAERKDALDEDARQKAQADDPYMMSDAEQAEYDALETPGEKRLYTIERRKRIAQEIADASTKAAEAAEGSGDGDAEGGGSQG